MFDKLPFNKLRYKKADLPSNKINDFVLPAITCTTENNGISCYVKKENATIFKNCISVAANGDAPVFYQSNEFTILQDAYVIDFKDKKLNKKENLFFTALLKKGLKKFDWANKSSWERVKNENILLPTTHNGEIDFNFMESFVAELEAERVAELEAYLAAASLKDYELTAAELSALSKFENYNWGEFRLGDLFEVNSSKKIFHANTLENIYNEQISNSLPYVVRTTKNNGIAGYINENQIYANEANTLSFAQDTFTVFYQKQKYFTGNKVKVLKSKFDLKNSNVMHFLVACFQKVLANLSWGDGSTVTSIKQIKIQLPINKDGDIDFEFMNNFIKAIEKLVIKDVVLYTDNKIKATKSIVSLNQ